MAGERGEADMVRAFEDGVERNEEGMERATDRPSECSGELNGTIMDHLYNACKTGDVPAVIECLSHGEVYLRARFTTSEETPLHIAVFNSHADVVKILLERNADVECRDALSQTPLHCAVYQEDPSLLRLLMEKTIDLNPCDALGNTPLLLATKFCHEAVVTILLDHGADPNIPNKKKQTAIYWACKRGQSELVKLLLNSGAAVNACEEARTPLYEASREGHGGIVDLLLEANADVTAGWNPIEAASEKNHKKVVKTLINHLTKLSLPHSVISAMLANIDSTLHPSLPDV